MKRLVKGVAVSILTMAASSPERHVQRRAELKNSAAMHDGKTMLKHELTPLEHAQFLHEKQEGVIQLKAREDLRLNVKGAELKNGDPLILYPCTPRAHEHFKLRGNMIRVTAKNDFCLNVEGGVDAGNKIITWPCAQDGRKKPHEEFVFDDIGRIHPAKHNEFCMNAKEGVGLGAELILWHCADDAQPNELFEFSSGVIRSKHKPELRFNVQGGSIAESAPLIMWRCEADKHEVFEFTERGQMRLRTKPDMCLHAEGGLIPGRGIVLWPCSINDPVPDNELFSYDEEKNLVYAVAEPNLVFTVKLSNSTEFNMGDQIILWPLKYKTEL